jgi:hypothetical protein
MNPTWQVVERIPIPLVIDESELPASAISEVTAADMPFPLVDWEGYVVEESKLMAVPSTKFSKVSVFLVSAIVCGSFIVVYILKRKQVMAWYMDKFMKKKVEKSCCHGENEGGIIDETVKKVKEGDRITFCHKDEAFKKNTNSRKESSKLNIQILSKFSQNTL